MKSSDDIGTVETRFAFSGGVFLKEGWMLCNGEEINRLNYEKIHGLNSFDRDEISKSPVAGMKNPNLVHQDKNLVFIIKVA